MLDWGTSTKLATTVALVTVLSIASMIDWREQRLPDWITLPLAGFGLLLSLSREGDLLLWSAMGAAAGYLSLWLVREFYRIRTGRDGLGLGDAKLLAAAGSWLGPLMLAPVILVASSSGLVAVGLLRIAGRPVSLSSRVPFGPFLSLGFVTCWLATLSGVV